MNYFKLLSIFLFFIPSLVCGFQLNALFYDDIKAIQITLNPNLISLVTYNSDLSLTNFNYIYRDPENKISSQFQIPNFLLRPVKFWFQIYTKYDASTIIIHDKSNVNIIYNIINFSEFDSEGIGIITKENLRHQLKKNAINKIKHSLKKIDRNDKLTRFDNIILSQLKNADISIPQHKYKRSRLIKSLIRNIRSQSGLKSQINKGLLYYQQYASTIDKYLHIFRLPSEVLALAFVESSFNPLAHSKANAVGVWQFITRTGKSYLNLNKYVDERKNILLSTLAAFHLLNENFKIQKNWPFALTAYNSGHSHIFKAKRKNKHRLTFEQFINSYSHPAIRFASKNYYSEFLAMVYALGYKKYFYNTSTNITPSALEIFSTKCHATFNQLRHQSGLTYKQFIMLNTHLKKLKANRQYPRKTSIILDTDIAPNNFQIIPVDKITKYYPKNFKRILKNYNCSTK